MPKTMTETNDVKSVAVPSVKPFPPGLARPDQTRDWATSLLSAVAAAGLTHAFRRIIMNEGARTDPTSVLDLRSEPALAHGVGSASSPAPRSEGGRPQSRS